MGSNLEIRPSEDPRCFSLVGEIDLANAEVLVERLASIASSTGDLRLDVGDVTFVDSTGLHALIRVARMLPEGSQLVLVQISSAVARLLELTGVVNAPELRIEGRRPL